LHQQYLINFTFFLKLNKFEVLKVAPTILN
jgi:hypothetical protein